MLRPAGEVQAGKRDKQAGKGRDAWRTRHPGGGPDPKGHAASWSAGQARLVEPVQQAGLALMPGAQLTEPLPERGRIILPLGERLQVAQQGGGQVVVERPFRLDQLIGLLPGRLGVSGELVEVLGVGGRPGRRRCSPW